MGEGVVENISKLKKGQRMKIAPLLSSIAPDTSTSIWTIFTPTSRTTNMLTKSAINNGS